MMTTKAMKRWSSAALLFVALGVAATVTADTGEPLKSATDDQKEAARKAYKKGAAAQKDGKLEEALSEYRKSYELVKSPNAHFMVVRTLRDMSQFAEAYEEARRLVHSAEQASLSDDKYAKTAAAARGLMREVVGKVVLVSMIVDAPGGSRVLVGDRVIKRKQWGDTIAFEPGKHTFVLESPNGKAESTVDLAAGQSDTIVLKLDNAPTTVDKPNPEGPPAEKPAKGCACNAPGAPVEGGSWALLALLAAVRLRRRS
jgi:MYXO-CTERM domain-containing protein